MTIKRSAAEAMKCLGNKLEIVALDPDPKALGELTEEYNCKNCSLKPACDKLYNFAIKL